MSAENPFKITVYDKAFSRKAIVSTPIELSCIPRHNLKGTATFSLGLDHPALGDLMESGSRVVIHYRGKQVMSGPVTARSINGPTISGSATFMVEDDFRILHGILGWPVPASAITNQSAAETYLLKGPAETVVKTAVAVNAARLGIPVTMAPDQGRGGQVTFEIRMEPLFDKLFPLVETAGLGVTVKQSGAGLVLDVYEPSIYLPLLSEESGIVQSWSWTNNAPKATNLVVGGRGQKAAREFRAFKDDDAIATWGMSVEQFEDANSAGSELDNWYSQRENALEAADRAGVTYDADTRELNTMTYAAAAAKNAANGVKAIYASGTPECSEALSDAASAQSSAASKAAQKAQALADKNAAAATLATIDAAYDTLRAEYEALIVKIAYDKLAELTEATGIRMVLSETGGFRYGDAVSVGDRVSMKVGPNLSLTDMLREAELTWTFDSGVVATPSVGEITDNPDRAFAKALRNSVTRIRKQEVK